MPRLLWMRQDERRLKKEEGLLLLPVGSGHHAHIPVSDLLGNHIHLDPDITVFQPVRRLVASVHPLLHERPTLRWLRPLRLVHEVK